MRTLLKKTVVILVILFSPFAVSSVCHSKTIDTVLVENKMQHQDAAKIKELFDSIKKFGVKEEQALLIIDNALKSGVETNKLLRIMVLISKTAVAEIPTKALMNKILEGLAKKAPVNLIIKEAESKVLYLKNAKAILNYFILKGYEVQQPDMAINMISIYLTKGWEPVELKREIESGGLKKEEFYELSLFIKK